MAEAAVGLMQRIRGGDAGALGELVSLHGAALRRHLQRYVPPADADDLLQELWLRVWQKAEQWDARGRLLAWLLAIATNLALNHLRAQRPVTPLAEVGEDDPSETLASATEALVPGPEEHALWRDQLALVQTALAALPADKRSAVQLVRIAGKSLRQAAQELGIPIGTLKSRLHHAQQMLAEQLEEDL